MNSLIFFSPKWYKTFLNGLHFYWHSNNIVFSWNPDVCTLGLQKKGANILLDVDFVSKVLSIFQIRIPFSSRNQHFSKTFVLF